MYIIDEVMLVVGIEPTCPARSDGFKVRCVYRFRHTSKNQRSPPNPRASFFVTRDALHIIKSLYYNIMEIIIEILYCA